MTYPIVGKYFFSVQMVWYNQVHPDLKFLLTVTVASTSNNQARQTYENNPFWQPLNYSPFLPPDKASVPESILDLSVSMA